ncbi:solute carrier family 2, facilitated glucose transporter member 8 [Patella vulgata]|uniref:solute carrier family 2, facilitated glucose transporter member 8 n=1 Tax=Patella vulgata TaxID=6465 RepID=UPI0024A87A41|nr:solute carrier family 2, facilitated glucose transporter member 8 [Patella vulgata]
MFAMEPTKARLIQSKYEGSPVKQTLAALLAATGALAFGYTIGYSSPAIPDMIKHGVLTVPESPVFGSLMTVGALVGGPLGGWFVEKNGRKMTILFASFPFILGWLAIAYQLSNSYTYLYGGRLLTGVASGMITVCVPVYIAEISSKAYRGVLGTLTQLLITIGILAVYVLGSYIGWSGLALIGALSGIFIIIGAFFLPESPHWLLKQGKKAEAIESLKALRDAHMDVGEECRDIEEGIDVKESVPLSEFLKPELFKPLLIIVFIMFFQQFSGINAVMFYTVNIFEKAVPSLAHSATIGIGVVQVIGTFVAAQLMDRAGRRKLLIFSGLTMAISLFGMAYYFHYEAAWIADGMKTSWLPVISLMLFVIGFSLGWGPIPMLVMSEILPVRVKGTASAIAIFSNWSFAFAVTLSFIPAQMLIGPSLVFCIFGAACFISVCFVLRFLPETKGKSLEDIELFFLGKSPITPIV